MSRVVVTGRSPTDLDVVPYGFVSLSAGPKGGPVRRHDTRTIAVDALSGPVLRAFSDRSSGPYTASVAFPRSHPGRAPPSRRRSASLAARPPP